MSGVQILFMKRLEETFNISRHGCRLRTSKQNGHKDDVNESDLKKKHTQKTEITHNHNCNKTHNKEKELYKNCLRYKKSMQPKIPQSSKQLEQRSCELSRGGETMRISFAPILKFS